MTTRALLGRPGALPEIVQASERVHGHRGLRRVRTEVVSAGSREVVVVGRSERAMRDRVGASDAGGQVCVMER